MKSSYAEVRRACLKPDENEKPWYPRHITHAISTRLVWLLQDLPLTPNILTTASLLAALAALPYFARFSPGSLLTGALFVELYYVLDAVDGQWARFKNQRSLTGAFFDVLINYAIQPPILFALAWGVYLASGDAEFLLLGFLAAFSTLWLLLIWNIRAAVLLAHLGSLNRAPAKPVKGAQKTSASKTSPIKWLFGWFHKSMVFPWFMYVLTVTSLVSFAGAAWFAMPELPLNAFKAFLLYYSFGGLFIAFALTVSWIAGRKIESSPELG